MNVCVIKIPILEIVLVILTKIKLSFPIVYMKRRDPQSSKISINAFMAFVYQTSGMFNRDAITTIYLTNKIKTTKISFSFSLQIKNDC